MIKQNVGVDISKDSFKVCFYQLLDNHQKRIKASRGFKNTLSGFKEFEKWTGKKREAAKDVHITLEATGVYHENLVYFLHKSGHSVHLLLANQAKAYAKSLNLRSKTDKVDAKMLGQMGIERDLQQWQPSSPEMRTLRQLTRARVGMLEEKTALSNRKHALGHSFEADERSIGWLDQRLQLLADQVKEVEKEIEQVVKGDETLREKTKNICTVKGLGLMTVATIIAETDGFSLFTNRRQLISYAGYDVVQRESGSSVKGKTKISKKGNRHIRRALYFPAISTVKYEPHFKQLFERVRDRSSIKMKGYVAVQRKILLLIYALYKSDRPYDPDYLKKQNGKKEKENPMPKISRQEKTPAYCG